MKTMILGSFSALALAAASPAMAQVTGDSESYTLNLAGTVASNCELIPEGSGTSNVDMLNTGNQGALTIAYSCNSPYTVSLTSLNGGMRHAESAGAVVIDYDVEAQGFFGTNQTTTNSATMAGTPVVIVTNTNWQNILTNGGLRTGNLDLSFDSIGEYAVAGTYSDQLTITLAANL
ncbi:hypothetical protein [Sphingomonas hylomeconis]|uniref:Spore coat protein U domain-containing protein n=1 Tax=Sphingomonas hylomeconis TaxID=1395958 RepID=A0ABV7SV94_9SPHN|nr:hypothetical protein [Sphingomonas hylomeconis]